MEKKCLVCGEPLRGRQTKYCSAKCKKRLQRHPELYPTVKTGTLPKSSEIPAQVSSRMVAAVSTGKSKQIYSALRRRLAEEIDATEDPKLVAVLASKLVEVETKMELFTKVDKTGSKLDELNARREKRRQEAS